jgi:hypothetical protein
LRERGCGNSQRQKREQPYTSIGFSAHSRTPFALNRVDPKLR